MHEHLRNTEIKAPKIRLIDQDGEMKGIVSRQEALRLAEEQELDLVEIQPNAEPPVCRIMDYGKFRYEQHKKASVARKHQKQVETKEIQFSPAIENHDYQTKINRVREFLADGNKVRIVVRAKQSVRNYDMHHVIMKRVKDDLQIYAQFEERAPGLSGGFLDSAFMMIASPLPKNVVKANLELVEKALAAAKFVNNITPASSTLPPKMK